MPETPTVAPEPEHPYQPSAQQGPSTGDLISQISTTDERPAPSTLATPTVAVSGTPDPPRFTILRLHAQGGLGQVSVARDEKLKRAVALKEIRPDRRDNASLRQRFLTEAEITGQLEHPGIVPIYDLDQDADGQVRYAMRFVQGHTLHDAILAYHRQPTVLAFRELLQRFISVCQTMAYAHSQGVIHRDLKPANIMLGDYGETLVVDWGLAKRLTAPPRAGAQSAPPSTPTSAPEQTIDFVPPLTEQGAQTQAGQAVGTPAYMAPEQAAGDLEAMGTPADIYSLGAILYQVLTGKPPFQGKNVVEVLAAARLGRVARPSRLRPGVPRALEAVCLKALALAIPARYPTAADLSRDIEHWLADEPVSAYPEPWSDRVRRWTRRHRTLVVGAAALLVTAVIALTIGILVVGQEQRRTRAALVAKEKQELRTRAALDTLTDDTVERLLQRKEELSEEDRAFLRKVLAHYEGFAADAGNDEQGRRAVAEAYGRVAQFRLRLGENKAAEEAFRHAAALFAALANDFPAEPEYRFGEQRNRNNLISLLRLVNRGEEALALLRELIPERRQLADSYPDRPRYRAELASSLTNLGVLLRERAQRDEADQVLREAIEARRQLAAADPAPEYRVELAASLNNLGLLYMESENLSAAEPVLREALKLRQELADQFPRKAEFRNLLARSHNNLGILLNRLGRPEQAADEYRTALPIRRRLTAELPTVPEYRSDLAGTLNNLAVVLKKLKHPEEAEENYREALAVQERLVAYFPESLLYAVALGNSYGNLGNLAGETGKHKAAVDWYAKAIPTLEGVLAMDRQQAAARRFLLNAYQNRAQSLAELRQDADAVKDYDRAQALDPGPRRNEFRVFRALSLARSGSTAKALAEVEALLKDSKLAAQFPGWVPYSAARVYAIASASTKEDTGRSAMYADRAVECLRQARAANYFKEANKVQELRKEPDFDQVQPRADFKQLVNELTGEKEFQGTLSIE
jgi:eukaryotic-like serine/threonine-protein kinase